MAIEIPTLAVSLKRKVEDAVSCTLHKSRVSICYDYGNQGGIANFNFVPF